MGCPEYSIFPNGLTKHTKGTLWMLRSMRIGCWQLFCRLNWVISDHRFSFIVLTVIYCSSLLKATTLTLPSHFQPYFTIIWCILVSEVTQGEHQKDQRCTSSTSPALCSRTIFSPPSTQLISPQFLNSSPVGPSFSKSTPISLFENSCLINSSFCAETKEDSLTETGALFFFQVMSAFPGLFSTITRSCYSRVASCWTSNCFRIYTASLIMCRYPIIINQLIQMEKELLRTKDILPLLRNVFPVLGPHSKKGENGRVGIIGGSYQFTGAPFYAAISSLKIGGDLAHIFCSKSAATAIKSYSPEIIVHPVFQSSAEANYTQEQLAEVHQDWLSKILTWKSAISAWIIGPGLGRDKYMQSFFPLLVKSLPSGSLLVFDADGIYFLVKHPELFSELKRFKTILTPNARELSLLKTVRPLDIEHLYKEQNEKEQMQEIAASEEYSQFSIFVKGREDLILTSKRSFIVRTEGGSKRCGGIGDIVAGVVAVCGLWDQEYGLVLASHIVKLAARLAFEKEGRGLTAPSVIRQLPCIVMKLEAASL